MSLVEIQMPPSLSSCKLRIDRLYQLFIELQLLALVQLICNLGILSVRL